MVFTCVALAGTSLSNVLRTLHHRLVPQTRLGALVTLAFREDVEGPAFLVLQESIAKVADLQSNARTTLMLRKAPTIRTTVRASPLLSVPTAACVKSARQVRFVQVERPRHLVRHTLSPSPGAARSEIAFAVQDTTGRMVDHVYSALQAPGALEGPETRAQKTVTHRNFLEAPAIVLARMDSWVYRVAHAPSASVEPGAKWAF